MKPPIDLRRLRAFVTVAETLHFGRAAIELNMAQPALTQQIQNLERELDTQLLVRDRRSVSLTPVGELLVAEAKLTLQQAERTHLTVSRAKRGEIGHIKISHVSSVAYSGLLSRLCYEFQKRLPDVHLELHELDLEFQLPQLAEGSFDVAFIRLPAGPVPEGIEILTLSHEAVYVCLRSDHPQVKDQVAAKDLALEPFLATHLREGYGFFDTQLRVCRAAGFEPRIAHRSRHFPTTISMVAAGRGIAFVPEPIRRLDLLDVVYRPLIDNAITSEVAIAYRAEDTSPAIQNFITLARQSIVNASP